jgi:hypothetical protein
MHRDELDAAEHILGHVAAYVAVSGVPAETRTATHAVFWGERGDFFCCIDLKHQGKGWVLGSRIETIDVFLT